MTISALATLLERERERDKVVYVRSYFLRKRSLAIFPWKFLVKSPAAGYYKLNAEEDEKSRASGGEKTVYETLG